MWSFLGDQSLQFLLWNFRVNPPSSWNVKESGSVRFIKKTEECGSPILSANSLRSCKESFSISIVVWPHLPSLSKIWFLTSCFTGSQYQVISRWCTFSSPAMNFHFVRRNFWSCSHTVVDCSDMFLPSKSNSEVHLGENIRCWCRMAFKSSCKYVLAISHKRASPICVFICQYVKLGKITDWFWIFQSGEQKDREAFVDLKWRLGWV